MLHMIASFAFMVAVLFSLDEDVRWMGTAAMVIGMVTGLRSVLRRGPTDGRKDDKRVITMPRRDAKTDRRRKRAA